MRENLVRVSVALALLTLVLSVALGLALADEPQGAAPVYMLPSTDGPTQVAAPEVKRFIIQLEDAPLARYTGGVKGYAATAIQATDANRLDVNAPASRAYVAYLEGKQEAFKAELAKALPNASVSTYLDERDVAHDLAYQMVFNGVVVTLPDASPQMLRRLAKINGVKQVYRDYEHKPDMYASLPLIGAPTMWSQLGGQDVSGEGIIVASIDTGVYAPNPFFDPTGYQYPPGYPVGDARYTTKKVIGARAYFRPWDPPTEGDEGAWPGPNGSSHGSHTIGTTAGNADTVAEVAGLVETISGVAPKAQILSYRIGYPTASEYSGSAFSAEIVMAYEDAVKDGADVINYSFGGYSGVMPWADAVAVARDATWDAGVFVSHSAGNSGPGYSTTWDSSPKVMEVAASSTTGTIAAGLIDVTSPTPVPEELTGFPFGDCLFCPPLTVGEIFGPFLYTDVATVTAGGTNTLCDDEEVTGDLTGQIALISRGGCYFSDKVWNAQQAGAIAAIVYNNAGDGLINMSAGSHEDDEFTIPGAFIGQTNGEGMVQWKADNPTAEAQFDYTARQIGNVPDVIASFSSRGPAFARFLEPDVTAPGVNILSGGYAPGATGVERHAGFGAVSGTSMAAPHVAGAAALLKQMHPDWTNDQIRSALMTTSVTEVWLDDDQTVPASVLDMGAGRIDLAKAGDPGLTFDYPSVSFGGVTAPATATAIVQATEVAGISATYDLSTTADEGITASTDLRSISVEPGGTASFELTVEIAEGTAPGDYGGFVWLEHGPHVNHIPFWVRVEAPLAEASVLLIDNDFSDLLGFPDYTSFYTDTLDSLGVTFDYYNADLHYANPQTLPSAAELAAYDVIIYWSGDNYYPDGTFTVATPLTEIDMQLLTDWQFNGGRLLVTGQDLASAWDALDSDGDGYFLYAGNLGTKYLQDTIFDPTYAGLLPPVPAVVGLPGSPLSGMVLDISGSDPITDTVDDEVVIVGWEDGVANQYYVDEVELAPYGDTEAPDSISPILAAVGGYPVQDGYVASARADSPTLERPRTRYDYRSIYLSFGFEGINNDTGYTTREELMDELLNWLTDEVAVTVGPVEAMVNDLVTLSAEATSSVGAEVVQYRWDFGDGSDIAVSTTPSVVHVYTSGGTYTARVEVTDEYGHKAVGEGTVTIIGGKIYLPFVAKSYIPPIKITVLHTNDEHGWLQPFVAYKSPVTEGGAASLMGRFTEIDGYSPDRDGFLLTSGGDMWTGPSITTWFEGEPMVEVMNAMGYDAAAIGNHEFDFGRDALNERIAEADFPFLSANIYYTGTTTLADFATPYIIEEVNGVKVGIVGLTTVTTAWTTHPKNITDLYFGDYEEALRREVPKMRAEGAEVIIVESHVCSSNLVPLAEAVSDLDIALMQGGHCHATFTGQVGDTAIIEAHWAMRAYGKTALYLDWFTHDVTDYTHEVIFNEYVTDDGNPVTPDPAVQAIVDYWQEKTDEAMGEVIGYTETGMLDGSWKQGNYVTDSWLWAYGTADFAMTNWGGFRADIEAGDITVGDIVGVLPFENRIMDCAITGAQLVENLEVRHAAVAGFTYTYHEEDGQTVVDSVMLADDSPLDMNATYHVLVNDFMYLGGDGYLFYQQDPDAYDTGIQWRQPVIDWTKEQNTSVTNPIDPLIDDQPRAVEITP